MALDAAEQSEANLSTHHFDLPCNKCHLSRSNEKTQGQLPNTWELKQDINKSCTLSKCHNFDPMLSHPVGIKPKGPIPKDMPLDNHSNITCLTCHKEPGHSDLGDGIKHLLRRSLGEQLCQSCHMNVRDSLAKQYHWRFSTRAHLITVDKQSFSPYDISQSSGNIDQESRSCLGCHDDINVTIPMRNETPREKWTRWKKMASHPIGMDYEYTALNKPRYNILSFQGSGIRLFNGKLGCGSCHSLYAETQYHLVADYQDSTLCRKCHDL